MEEKKNGKVGIVIAIIIALIVLFLPFIIHAVYKVKPITPFFDVSYSVSDILSYYGIVFTSLGTIFLGAITLHQNKKYQEIERRNQEMTLELNKATLELQRKSMALAEERSKLMDNNRNDDDNHAPKFEMKLSGYNAPYQNLSIEIKNISSKIVSNMSPLELKFVDSNNNIVNNNENIDFSFEKKSLAPNNTTIIHTKTPEMIMRSNSNNSIGYFSNIKLIVEFSCEDENYHVYYYRAILSIETTQKYPSDDERYFDVITVA